MWRITLAALLLGSLSCATGAAVVTTGEAGETAVVTTGAVGETTEDLDVDVEQLNAPMVMQGFNSVDVKFQIAVRNRTQTPVTVSHIALQSIGGSDYQIPSRTRPFNRTIAPGAQEKFEFWATARVDDPTIGTKAPLTVRTMLTLRDAQGQRTESFVRRVNGRVAIGITGT